MSAQTRAAFRAEYLAARAADDIDAVIALHFAAMDHDAEYPDEPSLMAELRGLHTLAVA